MKHILTLAALVFATACFGQVPDYVPTEGLVAWLSFNNGVLDEGPLNNTATDFGSEEHLIALVCPMPLETLMRPE